MTDNPRDGDPTEVDLEAGPRDDAAGERRARRARPSDDIGSRLQQWRVDFRGWRRKRPFWGPLALILGGFFVLKPVLSSIAAVVSMGGSGVVAYVLGGGMIAAALTAMFLPEQRHFPSVMAVIFSIASLPLANLGGWVIGMVLGIVGGAMTFAWTPYTPEQRDEVNAKEAEKKGEPAPEAEAPPETRPEDDPTESAEPAGTEQLQEMFRSSRRRGSE